MISDSAKAIIKYGSLKGIGKRFLAQVLDSCARKSISVEDFFVQDVLRNKTYENSDLVKAERYADEQIATARSLGHHIICMNDSAYPESLRSMPDSPPIIYCSGDVKLLEKESVTIIGTREPTEHGTQIAQRVTTWFVAQGWVITSGLAKGIDTVAHQACIGCEGKTIAVMAHGLEKVYPAANKGLAEDIILKGGLLISEYGYGSFVGRSNFVERDRIQAALSKGVVLVQSDSEGGSMHASRAALHYGRYLLVLGQSDRDINAGEPKIGANMLLAEPNVKTKMDLLKVSAEKLEKLLIVEDKRGLPVASEKLRKLVYTGRRQIESSDLFT